MSAPAGREAITVVGARSHNLKDISVEIPLNSLTVITGVSGSGKSTLAFDTLYAEGQRRYVASLSAYARQFLERVQRPDVTDILGICPALAIRQKSYSRNPRSTVGTVTEINDYLRLLYARIGTTLCIQCGREVEKDSPESIAGIVEELPVGTRVYVCSPLALDGETPVAPQGVGNMAPAREETSAAGCAARREEHLAVILPGLRQQGFARLLIGEQLVRLEDAMETVGLHPGEPVHVVVDRLVVERGMRERLVDSLELCGRESDGRIELVIPAEDPAAFAGLIAERFARVRCVPHALGLLLKFSQRFECPLCHVTYEAPEPRLFSFNNPFGACPECQGFGNTITLDFSRIIPDPAKSLAQGAVHPWTKPRYKIFHNRLLLFAQKAGIDPNTPWRDLPEEQRRWVTHGRGEFPGITGFFARLEEKKYKMHVRIFISRYRGYATCPECHGERLRREARNVVVAGKRISEILHMTVSHAARFFNSLALTDQQTAVAHKILDEVRSRLDLLERVGLAYLTLDRLSSTLSGGESQRIQLATSLGSTMVGALYVLDEPSIGLHPRDSQRLVQILRTLRTMGNTVVVVEHDAEIMLSSDYIIDLGPGAGENGGRVVYQGELPGIASAPESLTGRYLKGELRIPTPRFRRKGNGRTLEITGARRHNLKDMHLHLPLGLLVCITGVSGSGKSTLVHDVLYHAVRRVKGAALEQAPAYDDVRGAEHITEVVMVDQSPIGRTPRSNPVTYIKAFDFVRQIFAETRDAYARSLKSSHFSFNLPGGRCETCQGNGTITVEMQFLADVELPCEDCRGTRFKSSVLEVRYKGMNIAEVLELSVREAMEFFAAHPRLTRRLRILEEVGLGYVRLGQPATSLSGGEAQRIKLASYITGKQTGGVLYIFDEPTTGLHFDDIRKLLSAFDRLVNPGNTVLVVEHNLDVIKTADWVIDLGPEGGEEGGRVVFEGSPDDLIHCREGYTGRFLRDYLERRSSREADRVGARVS